MYPTFSERKLEYLSQRVVVAPAVTVTMGGSSDNTDAGRMLG
jgi:hypothetical protein